MYATPRYGLTVITPPTEEPVSLEEMKLHLRYEYDDDNVLIETLITAAREWVERYTGRTLVDTTLEVAFEGYPDWFIDLPKPPVIAVQSFKYRTSDGTDTTLADDQYTLDNAVALSPRIVPAYGIAWPGTRWQASSLRVRYRAGYADLTGSPQDTMESVPASLRAAIKLIVAHLYEHRESVTELKLEELPMGVQWLCRPFRVEGMGA